MKASERIFTDTSTSVGFDKQDMTSDDGDDSEEENSSIVDKAESAAVQALTGVDLEVSLPDDTLVSMYEAAEAVEESRKTIRDSIDWAALYNAVESAVLNRC